LEKAGYKKLDVWVPHALIVKNLIEFSSAQIIAKMEQNQTIFYTAYYGR